jgi:hypothetical protein
MRTVVARLSELDAGSPQPQWHALTEIAGDGSTRSRRESLRRAVKALAADGTVTTSYLLGAMTKRGRPGKLHVRLAAQPVPVAEPDVLDRAATA